MNRTLHKVLFFTLLNVLILSCSKKLHIEDNSTLATTELSSENLESPWKLTCAPLESTHFITSEVILNDNFYEETITLYSGSSCDEQNVTQKYRVRGTVVQKRPHPTVPHFSFLELARESEEVAVFDQSSHDQIYHSTTNAPALGAYHPVPSDIQRITPNFHIVFYDSSPDDNKMKIALTVYLSEEYEDGINANFLVFSAMTQQEIDSFPHYHEKI